MKERPRLLFASTACLPGEEPVTARITRYHRLGLDSVELGGSVRASPDDLLRIAGMDEAFLVHNYFPPPADPFVLNLASADRDIRQRSIDLVRAALDLSAQLRAPFYSVHAGFVTDPTGFGGTSFIFPMPNSPDESNYAMERFVAALEITLEHASQLGLKLLVENNVCTTDLRGKLLLQTADEFAALFETLTSPHLGLLLDTGHLNVSARTFGFDRVAFVDRIAAHIEAFHVHDNDGLADRHQPVGETSWVLGVLSRTAFAGLPLVVEARFGGVDALHEHVTWLTERLGAGE